MGALVQAGIRAARVAGEVGTALLGDHGRGIWWNEARCWVEVVDRGDASYRAGVGAAVAAVVSRLPGVDRVDVNAPLQRLVIHFARPPESLEGMLLAIDHAEQRWWQLNPPTHKAPERVVLPGESRTVALRGATLAADVAGLAVAAAGSLGKWARLPSASPAVTTLIDTQPRLRGVLERRLGRDRADALIGCANAMLQGVSGAAPALLVDLVARGMTVGEAQANRLAWALQEPQLVAHAESEDWSGPARLRARASGVVDRYSDVCGAGGLLAATALVVTGRPELAGRVVLASAPKASRYAQQAFSSTVGRLLCQRAGGVLLQGQALGLLGNVDAVVIDPRVLVTQTAVVSEIQDASGSAREALWHAATQELADGTLEPGWHRLAALSPLRDTDGLPPDAMFLVTRTPEPLAVEVLDAARSAGLVCGSLDVDWLGPLRSFFDELESVTPAPHHLGGELSTDSATGDRATADSADEASVDQARAEGTALTALVARLQAEGRTVLVLGAAQAAVAMPAADVSVGIGARPAWTADVLVPELGAAWHLVNAVPVARTVNRRSVELAVGATVLESLLLLSPRARRFPGPVVTAGALALFMGWRSGREVMSRALPPVMPRYAWHAMSPDEVCRALPPRVHRTAEVDRSSSPASRDDRVAALVGTARKVVSVVREDLDDPMSPVLATGAAASAILGAPADAALVSGVMFGNALLSGVQRLRAEQLLARLLATNNAPARVVLPDDEPAVSTAAAAAGSAEGMAYVDVPGSELRPGEVVEVRAGEVVPADARILAVDPTGGVEVDESALTGESLSVRKSVEATAGAALAERTCMLYEGTVVLTGTVVAVVTATGAATEAGRALALSPSPSRDVGLQAQLSRLTGSVLPLTMAGGVTVTGLGLLRGNPVREAVASGVAIAVAAVPEGLPLIATLAQQAAARRLARAGVLARTPAAVEALGRVEVICFDKTGTLTENALSVKVAHPCPAVSEETLKAAAALATPVSGADGLRRQSTDAAVAQFADEHRPLCDAELSFRSGRPYSAGLSGTLLAVKGAPETVLAGCGTSLTDWPQVEQLAAQGLRVLAVARRGLTDQQARRARTDPEALERLAGEKLCLLGFLGISDTVRPGARALMSDLASGGLRPVVITGDHPLTAVAVLADIGLDVSPSDIMTGTEWSALSRRQRVHAVKRITVFARMSPEHKVQVVQSLEAAGVPTAMVGDGANDAAAIRAASVGVGVSTGGSDPARGAADVVLLEGQVERLGAALDEGAQLWRSVEAAVAMLLGGNAGEVAFTALGVALSGTAPLNARQLLLVNLLTDALPAAALAVSTPAASHDDGRRGMNEEELWRRVVERGTTTTFGATTAWGLARLTGRPRRASTIGLVALVATQLGQTMVDSPTPLVVGTATGSLAALAVAISTPGLSQSLGCTPLGPIGWGQALGCATSATVLSALTPTLRQALSGNRSAGPAAPLQDGPQLSPPQPATAPARRGALKNGDPHGY